MIEMFITVQQTLTVKDLSVTMVAKGRSISETFQDFL